MILSYSRPPILYRIVGNTIFSKLKTGALVKRYTLLAEIFLCRGSQGAQVTLGYVTQGAVQQAGLALACCAQIYVGIGGFSRLGPQL